MGTINEGVYHQRNQRLLLWCTESTLDKVESIELTWLEFDDTYDYKLIIKPHIKVTFKK